MATESQNIAINFFMKNVKINQIYDHIVHSFIVKISPISNERNISNNSFRFYVDVINTKYNILLVHDDTHPDLGSYVNVINRNKDYKLDVISSKDLIQDLSSYSLIVFHSISNENDDFVSKIKENSNIP